MTNIKIKKQYATLALCLAVGFLSTTAEANTECLEEFLKCDVSCQRSCESYTMTSDLARYCKRIGSKPSVTEYCKDPWNNSPESAWYPQDLNEQEECLAGGNAEQ